MATLCEDVADAVFTILNVITLLPIYGIRQIKDFSRIYLFTRFELLSAIFEIVIEQQIGPLVVQVELIDNFARYMSRICLNRAQNYKGRRDVIQRGDVDHLG